MPGEQESPVEAFGGLVVLSFEMLGTEILNSPERIARILTGPEIRNAVEKKVLDFAKSRNPSSVTQLTTAEIEKLTSQIASGASSAATDEYKRLITSSPKYKALQSQVELFLDALESSAIGVWADKHRGILYVVGAALAVGGATALYITKPQNKALAASLKELEKLKFDIITVGKLTLSNGGIIFDPTAERIGAKLNGRIAWERLKIEIGLQVITKSLAVSEINGEVMLKYGIVDFTGQVKNNFAKPGADITLKLGLTKDRFGLSIAAHIKDQNVTGSAAAAYNINRMLKVDAEYSRGQQPEFNNAMNNMLMFNFKASF